MARKRSGLDAPKLSTVALGKRIKSIRVEKGMSKQKLANKLGVYSSYVSQLESGDRTPSFDTLIDIINILDVSSDELLFDYLNAKNSTIPLNSITRKLENVSPELLQKIEAHIILELTLNKINETE